MERKEFAFAELKSTGDDPGGFEGYASTYGVDLQNDQVIPGAFRKHLDRFLKHGFIAYQHQWNAPPVAMPTKAREDARGLFIGATYHSTQSAREVRTTVAQRVAAGMFVGLSIGFDVPAGGAKRRGDGVRELHEIVLHEVSIVHIPANAEAEVTAAKGGARAWRDPELDRIRSAMLRRQSERIAARLHSARLRDEWKAMQERTFLYVVPERVDPETRRVAHDAARIAAAELGVRMPRVAFFTPETAADRRAAHGLRASVADSFDGFRGGRRLEGRAHRASHEIEVDARLSGADLLYIVAHEVKHLHDDGSESAAQIYGQDFATRYRVA